VLLPFAAFVGFVASRREPARIAVWVIIAMNIVWVVDSIVLLFTGWVAPSALGYAFVIAQAAVVLVLADLEYMGLKRSAVVVV
jgi:CHASE2 domain-containing sensor protein